MIPILGVILFICVGEEVDGVFGMDSSRGIIPGCLLEFCCMSINLFYRVRIIEGDFIRANSHHGSYNAGQQMQNRDR